MKSFITVVMISVALGCVPAALAAEDTQNTAPIVCATIETYDCGFEENCTRGTAADIALPLFLDIDFDKKVITATMEDGEVNTTGIQALETLPGGIIIQGIEDGLGFSIAYNKATRKFTGSVSGDQVGFIIFGACKPE